MATDEVNATIFPVKGNNDTFYNTTLEELSKAEVGRKFLAFLFLAAICLTGTIGNSLVCYVYRSRQKLANSQIFIMWMALVDLLSCSVFIPLVIATEVNNFQFENVWLCKLSRFFNTWAAMSSATLLLVIATDRFRKVCRSTKWQIKVNVAKRLGACAVLLGLILSWPALVIYGKKTYAIPEYKLIATQCSTDDAMLRTIYPLITQLVSGGLVIFAVVYICVLYCLIGNSTRLHTKNMKKITTKSPTSAVSIPLSTILRNDSMIDAEIDQKASSTIDSTCIHAKTDKTSLFNHTVKPSDNKCDLTNEKGAQLQLGMDSDRKSKYTDEDDSNAKILTDVGSNVPCAICPADITGNDEKSNVRDSSNKESLTSMVGLEVATRYIGASEKRSTDSIVEDTDTDTQPQPQPDIERDRDILAIQTRDSVGDAMASNVEANKQGINTLKPESLFSQMCSFCCIFRSKCGQSISVAKPQDRNKAHDTKITVQMFVITTAFMVTYVPHILLMIIRTVKVDFVENLSNVETVVYFICLGSYFLNCAINPIIYGACDLRFRKAVKHIFFRRCNRASLYDTGSSV